VVNTFLEPPGLRKDLANSKYINIALGKLKKMEDPADTQRYMRVIKSLIELTGPDNNVNSDVVESIIEQQSKIDTEHELELMRKLEQDGELEIKHELELNGELEPESEQGSKAKPGQELLSWMDIWRAAPEGSINDKFPCFISPCTIKASLL